MSLVPTPRPIFQAAADVYREGLRLGDRGMQMRAVKLQRYAEARQHDHDYYIRRTPGCTCCDRQLTQVGCECGAE